MGKYKVQHPPFDASRKDGEIEVIDGCTRVWQWGYALRRYEPPTESEKIVPRLLQIMEMRLDEFFRHAESGISPPRQHDLNKYIEVLRKEYNEADTDEVRIRASYLVGALFKRAVTSLEREVQNSGGKIALNDPALEVIRKDLDEALGLLKYVKRKGVDKDRPDEMDEVLQGVCGEFIHPGTKGVTWYYQHGYERIAAALKEIDKVASKAKEVIETIQEKHPKLKEAGAIIDRLANASKCRAEITRSDMGDYAEGVAAFRDVHAEFDVASRARRAFVREIKNGGERLPEDLWRGIHVINEAARFMISMGKIRAREDKNLLSVYYKDCDREITMNRRTNRISGGEMGLQL